MRIVEQSRLWFREGTSDKVYEVDLVEVAAGQYVVNFRYGRRGTALRDGTKTPLPVPLDKARGIFTALVAEKQKGGYQVGGDGAPTGTAAPARRGAGAAGEPGVSAKARRRLIDRLRQGHRGSDPLYLAVRKAGELGLKEAEPALLELLGAAKAPQGMKEPVWRHLLVCALARCGSSTSVAPLERIAGDDKALFHLRHAARLALAMILTTQGAAGRARTVAMARELLPADPRALLDAHDAPSLIAAMERQSVHAPAALRASLAALYLVADPGDGSEPADEIARTARTAVMGALRVLGRTKDEFGAVRVLFWSAEVRRDAGLYARLGRHLEGRPSGGTDASVAYLRRRMARTLRRLASIQSPDYVKFAGALIERYSDEDAEPVRQTEWGNWDGFGRYHALNQVLYANSPRYEKAHHRKATWKLRARHAPGEPPPRLREEDHPELWDRAPDALWRLARLPLSLIGLQFASRALRDQTAFLDGLAAGELADAMGTAHPLTQAVACEAAMRRPIDAELARGAAASTVEAAHAWVLAWVRANPRRAADDPAWLALLCTARAPSLRDAAVQLAGTHAIELAVLEQALERALATLVGLGATDEARAAGARDCVARIFDALLGQVSLPIARELLLHPLWPVAAVGAEIVLRMARRAHLPGELLDALLTSPHAEVRRIGARILAETPAEILKDSPDVLALFALSDNAELREGTRGLFGEVARRYPEAGAQVAGLLVDALLRALPEGAPAHVLSLLRNELASSLPRRDKGSILALLGALSPHAREAGGLLLPQLTVDELTLDEIVRLAGNEILSVRQGAWALARAALDRFQLAPVALARLCDARWDDSRDFGFELVRSIPSERLSVDAIIAICDSTKPLVQAFGQSLLHQHFRAEDAGRYLLRLAEHPSTSIQLLVSGLLDRYARGDARRIAELLPYFYTVLSQVNRGAVAKQRVVEFVREQALGSPELAALLGPLLDRQSATSAITQKHPLIATMAALRERHPEVPLPLELVPPEPSRPAAKEGGPRAV